MIEASLKLSHGPFVLDVALRLPGRGVTVLLGPSGCGKTTVLRCIAGLSRAAGRVQVPHVDGSGEDVWQDDALGLWRPVHARPIGVVFQEASLFPHLSVKDNLLYGHKRVAAARRRVQFDEAVDLLGIGHLLARRPDRLSGGERQRAAIARALLCSPALLLMDEPLSALDAARKAEVLPYLEGLSQAGVPIVYVTHAMDEAARLADHLVLMDGGRVHLDGPAGAVFSRLDTPLSQLDDAAAIVAARVAEHHDAHGLTRLDLGDGASGSLSLWVGRHPANPGQPVRARVLARDVSVSLSPAPDSSILNILPATIDDIRIDAAHSVTLRLRLSPDTALLARLTQRSTEALALRVGMRVYAQIKGAALL